MKKKNVGIKYGVQFPEPESEKRSEIPLLDFFGGNGGGETGVWNQCEFGANRNFSRT